MELVVVLARLALAVTFLVSAVAKLRDLDGAQKAVRDFGVPASLVPVVGLAVPALELASATLLLTTGVGVTAGALLAAGLLAAFTVGIVTTLLRGKRVECHCFGALSTKPLSWWSVARNAGLVALALVALSGGSGQGFPWAEVADFFAPLDDAERWLTLAVLALAAAVAALGVLFVTLLGRYGHVLLRLEALESAGHVAHAHGHARDFAAWPAPDLTVTGADGVELTLPDLLDADRATFVAFVAPNCQACGELADDLRTWQADTGDDAPRVVVLSPGEREAITEKFGDVEVLAHDGTVTDTWRMEYTPGALVVSGDGLIVTPPAYGADDVRKLYRQATGRPGPVGVDLGPPPVREGDPLPDVTVSLVGAGSVDDAVEVPIAEAAGDDALLLFWDTTCGFCEQIAGDVVARQDDVPLLLVLRGTNVDDVRGAGLTGPVALDPRFAVGGALQAPGTPVAVRVRSGEVASTVAVGGPEVLDLLAAVRVTG